MMEWSGIGGFQPVRIDTPQTLRPADRPVTIVFNVPLNKALAAVDPDKRAGADLWTRDRAAWTSWKPVRTAAPLAAAAPFIMAPRWRSGSDNGMSR
jgi:hypothetical protein